MIGHHGTSREMAKSILTSGFNKLHGEQWFGGGVYFFEDDPLEAKNFAIKIRCFVCNWVVLRADIKTETDRVLDLTKAKAWGQFMDIRETLTRGKQNTKYKDKVENDAKTIDFMCKKFEELTGHRVDLVKCTLNVPGYEWTSRVTNLQRVQSQVCVRNLECIINVMEEAV